MKRVTILFFAIITLMSVLCQDYIHDGDRCFDDGDYACATINYTNAFKNAVGKEKQITEIKLTRAKWCVEHIKTAYQAYAVKNYPIAKEEYQKVLDSNPKDSYAKTQLDKCISYLTPVSTTLTLSKSNLSFTALGGNETITITTNSSSYSIELLPNFCTVQKYSGYFVITCKSNPVITARTDYFTVKAGDKSVRVNVSQVGRVEATSNKILTTLSLSKDYIYFDNKGGNSESIKVYSNAGSYSVSMLPSWCNVKSYDGYFVMTCNSNLSPQKRGDWCYVNAGDKQVKLFINQDGTSTLPTTNKLKKTKPTNLYLGVGAFKPMVFNSDREAFSNKQIGYNFMIGIVKTVGIYSKISTNFSEETENYFASDLPNTYYALLNTEPTSTFNRFSVVGGLMLQIKPVILYFGAGKGHYYHYNQTDIYKYIDDSYAQTINLTTISHTGIETDAGLIINFNKVGIMFGVSSISFKYMELSLGLGLKL